MNKADVNLTLGVDSRGLKTGSEEGAKGLGKLDSEVKKTTSDAAALEKESKATERAIDHVGDSAKQAGTKVEGLGKKTRDLSRNFSSIQTTGKILAWGSDKIVNRWTAMAGGFGAAAMSIQSAGLDKSLTQIKLTAGATREEANQLRQDLFKMGQDSGQSVEDLAAGFNNLVQSGQSWGSARQEIEATSIAMAVTNANASILTNGLSVAGEAFQFDLSKPGKALEILDKMTVAGRLGNAELENLSDIFARVGVNAKAGGMGFEQTLAFLETLSFTERNPERLATLADSTLRLFTNMNYQRNAQKATGVKFFDVNGSRRDAVAILADLQTQYKKLGTDQQRARWMQKAFGQADLDTIKGLRTLLGGEALQRGTEFAAKIAQAGGTLKKDLPEAMDNAISQSQRLKATMIETADQFARPVNVALKSLARFGSDHKQVAKTIEVAGAGLLIGAVGIATIVKVAGLVREFKGLLPGGKGGGLSGVAGAMSGRGTPVYVTNMPGSGIAGLPTISGEALPTVGAGRWGRLLARPGVAGGMTAGVTSLAMYGNTVEGWGGFAGSMIGAEAGAKLGAMAGPLGMLIGGAIGAVIGATVIPWLGGNVDEAQQQKAAIEDADKLGTKRTRAFLGASDAAGVSRVGNSGRMSNMGGEFRLSEGAIQLNVVTQVDSSGRSSTKVTGPSAGAARVRSIMDEFSGGIRPNWAPGGNS